MITFVNSRVAICHVVKQAAHIRRVPETARTAGAPFSLPAPSNARRLPSQNATHRVRTGTVRNRWDPIETPRLMDALSCDSRTMRAELQRRRRNAAVFSACARHLSVHAPHLPSLLSRWRIDLRAVKTRRPSAERTGRFLRCVRTAPSGAHRFLNAGSIDRVLAQSITIVYSDGTHCLLPRSICPETKDPLTAPL